MGCLCPQALPRPAATDKNKSTKTRSAWGGKVANLSKEKDQEPVPQRVSIGLNLLRNTGCVGKAHQSLSGRNDQIIGNIQRTMRAYLESGSDGERSIKLWENKLISGLDPYHLN